MGGQDGEEEHHHPNDDHNGQDGEEEEEDRHDDHNIISLASFFGNFNCVAHLILAFVWSHHPHDLSNQRLKEGQRRSGQYKAPKI